MTRTRPFLATAAVPLALAALTLLPASPAAAQDGYEDDGGSYGEEPYEYEEPAPASVDDDGGDDFSPLHLGVEGGLWRILLDAKATVGGDAAAAAGLTEIDLRRELDLREKDGAPWGRLFFDSRFIGLRFTYWQAEFRGSAIVQRTFNFADITVTAASDTRSELDLKSGDLQIQLNLLNNSVVRLGVYVEARVLYARAKIEADLDDNGVLDLSEEEDEYFPLPSIGVDAAIRLFGVLELSGRASYFSADWLEIRKVTGDYIEAEGGVTFYPLFFLDSAASDLLGLRVSYLYQGLNVQFDDEDRDDEYSLDLRLQGFLFTVILQF